ncbi:MAG: type II secretion system protein [Bacillota bacterium]
MLRRFRLLPLNIHSEKGFTLIELMVVGAIISIIVATALPQFTRQSDKARETAALAGLRSMKTVVDLYYAEKSELPTEDNSDADGTIKAVMNESGIAWGGLSDPWGGFYIYRVDEPKHIIFTTRDNSTYYFVTDRHLPTIGPFPDGYPVSGGVPSKASGSGQPSEPPEGEPPPPQEPPEGEPPPPQEPPEGEPPSVATMDATNITKNRATLIMAYDFKGYASGQVRFAYRPSGGGYAYTRWVDKAGSGTYAETIKGLRRNTTYYFKAQLKYGPTVVDGSELSFTTRP